MRGLQAVEYSLFPSESVYRGPWVSKKMGGLSAPQGNGQCALSAQFVQGVCGSQVVSSV